MESKDVNSFINSCKKFFPSNKVVFLKEKLLATNVTQFNAIKMRKLKNPTTMLIVSLFLGSLGADRFMLGEFGMGLIKLFTGGLFGILWLFDVFTISKKTKELNFKNLIELL